MRGREVAGDGLAEELVDGDEKCGEGLAGAGGGGDEGGVAARGSRASRASCGSVGEPNLVRNHSATTGWAQARARRRRSGSEWGAVRRPWGIVARLRLCSPRLALALLAADGLVNSRSLRNEALPVVVGKCLAASRSPLARSGRLGGYDRITECASVSGIGSFLRQRVAPAFAGRVATHRRVACGTDRAHSDLYMPPAPMSERMRRGCRRRGRRRWRLQSALGGEDEVDGVAAGTVAAGVGRDVVGGRLGLGRALAVAMERPQARMTGRSTTSSPT